MMVMTNGHDGFDLPLHWRMQVYGNKKARFKRQNLQGKLED